MSNIRKRDAGQTTGIARVISVVFLIPRKLRRFAPSAFLAKRALHEDEIEELVVGLISVRDAFQELCTLTHYGF